MVNAPLLGHEEQGMREPGWYWVKYAISTPWQASLWDGTFWYEVGTAKPQREPFWFTIGPKIEEPKDE